jgi:uncharacterized membrane protein YeaQ/YmgE (transglycosylase-associated protein family)
MQVTDIISAILVGAVIGVLGRLVLPGRQRIGVIVTLLIGIGAAFLGAFVARRFGWDDRAPVSFAGLDWDWIVLAIQVGFAVVGTAIAAAITHTRVAADEAPARRTRTRSRAKN